MKWRFGLTIFVVVSLGLIPGEVSRPIRADKVTTLRFASLAPPGSTFNKILRAWNNSLQKATNNTVKLRFYSGGSQGDERDFVRKARAGQVDGAGVSTTGLGMVVRSVLVLAAPGVVQDYEALARVRKKLDARFEKMFDKAGYKLLAWGDAGKNRLFSTRKIEKPEDVKVGRPWAWKDDPIYTEFLKVIGANPVPLGVPEVYPALQTGMIDSAPASALAAVAMQWYTKLNFMTKDNLNILIGASLLRKDKFNALSKAEQDALVSTGRRAARALDKLVRRDDEKAYRTLLKRGIEEIDTSAHKAAWDKAAKQTRERLTGRVYSKELLRAVQKAAKGS